jgi:hypothetical protein
MNYNNICLEDSCETPVSSGEYGSYCPSHRLDTNGCCRNHCLIDEEGGHCIHCIGNYNIDEISDIGYPEGDIDGYENDTDDTEHRTSGSEEIEDFHENYQVMAPTREEQLQRLSMLNIQLCEECKMPCEYIWCKDCWF